MERFTEEHYAPLVTGASAKKLADSQVAPLVAQARDVRHESFSGGKDGGKYLDHFLSGYRLKQDCVFSATVSGIGKSGGAVMALPWYEAGETEPELVQLRPENPYTGGDGKQRKYVFGAGSNPGFFSAHPALGKHLKRAPHCFVTEGVLKEDSLLTAQLLDAGGDFQRLATLAKSPQQAREIIGEMLEDLFPNGDRFIAPLSIAGVNGIQGMKPITDLRGQTHAGVIYVAFDGDVKTNPNVRRAADTLFRNLNEEGFSVSMIDLGSDAALAQIREVKGFENIGKSIDGKKPKMLGVDDYLSHIGDYKTLLSYGAPIPGKDNESMDYGPETWRVHPDGLFMQKQSGNNGWGYVYPIAAKVCGIQAEYTPTWTEIHKGLADPINQISAAREIELTFGWSNAKSENEVCKKNAIIPAESFQDKPERWGKDERSGLPLEVLFNDSWPPLNNEGFSWLNAVKRTYSEGVVRRQLLVNGWTATDSGIPMFVVGGQKLGGTETDRTNIEIDFDALLIPHAERFGVKDNYPDSEWESKKEKKKAFKKYRKEVVKDIETLFHCFFVNTPWGGKDGKPNRHYGAIVLGTAYRTCVPLRPTTVAYFEGTPGSGKSWSASFTLGAWQQDSGVWGTKNLPGSAKDTAFATSKILSRAGAGVWVIDDLAPQVSLLKAQNEETGVEDVIRAVHNGSGRARGNVQGSVDAPAPPRAQVLITAENDISTASASERVVSLSFQAGLMHHKHAEAVITECIDSLVMSRVSAALIRYFLHSDSWKNVVQRVTKRRENVVKALVEYVTRKYQRNEGLAIRRCENVGDLVLPLVLLRDMYLAYGGDKEHPLVRVWSPEIPEPAFEHGQKRFHMLAAVGDMADQQLQLTMRRKPGKSLLQALVNAFDAGQVHVSNLTIPGQPPFPDDEALSRRLGWEKLRGEWTPRGVNIGEAARNKKTGQTAVLLNPANAFQVAQKHAPTLILHGQKEKSSWSAAVAEGIALPSLSQNARAPYLHPIMTDSGQMWRAIIPVDLIISPTSDTANDGGEDENTWG